MARMKTVLFTLLAVVFSTFADAQLYKPKKKKKDFFGKKENPTDKVRPIGLQFQLGPTYTFTKNNETFIQSTSDESERYQYLQDPNGRIGFFAEFGLVHFNMKEPKYKFGRFVDYIDYGVGFKLFRGNETTQFDRLDAVGNLLSTEMGEGNFSNGYLYARFAVHKLQYLNKTKNIFLDHSLGINGDFLVTGGSTNYKAPVITSNQAFAADFAAKLHYDIGFGIRLKKGKYLVPGVQLPILGISEWNRGNPSLHWYSSKYYPVLFHVKYIHLLPAKKQKHGCYQGDPADKKKNEEYMQNR